jgi:hypothetical protein
LIVIVVFFGPILLFLLLSGIQIDRHSKAALDTVRASLKGSCIQLFMERLSETAGTNLTIRAFGSQELLAAFCDTNTGELKSTGFVFPTNIWIAAQSVSNSGTSLLCVVRVFGDEHYGIDEAGRFRKVEESEFIEWPHLSTYQMIDTTNLLR